MHLRQGKPQRRSKMRWALAVLVTALMAGATACGGSAGDGSPGQEAVSGRIVEIVSLGLLDIESITIEDSDGTLWRFEARGARFSSFSPSHLTEHKVQGLRVTVTFHREGDSLVVSAIGD